MERRLRERGSIGGSLLSLASLVWGCTTPNDGAGGAGAASGTSGTLASNASTGTQPQPLDVFTDAYPNLQLEIDYATGAEPYTGNLIGFGDIWDIFKANALRLFEGRFKALSVPTELAQMEELTDVTATGFTTDDIFAIVARHRDAPSAPPTATFYVLYLNGVYVEDGKENPGVLGINFGGTGVIAMFKPVIESTSAGPANVERFSEQATLVHEFGHAVGLVDAGVPMASAHRDTEHGAHCSNPDCVMNWTIDGTSGMVAFLKQHTLTNQSVLFGSECLADVDAVK